MKRTDVYKQQVMFDPIVGRPMDAYTYKTIVFETPAVLSTHVPASEIEEFLEDSTLWYSLGKKFEKKVL